MKVSITEQQGKGYTMKEVWEAREGHTIIHAIAIAEAWIALGYNAIINL